MGPEWAEQAFRDVAEAESRGLTFPEEQIDTLLVQARQGLRAE